jgi:hypothetical protein
MLKKTVWLVSLVLFAVFVYTTVLPVFNRPPEYVEAPDYCKAIMHYANNQLSLKYLNLPAQVSNWEIEEVLILKMEDIPGPHKRKIATASVCGSYIIPAQGTGKKPRKGSFDTKLVFNVGNRYPSGIDVQHVRFR